ncbi:MAG: biopolymer transporter ExbD [Litorilituus sp.]|jgi:biopolymer transport protein ExbD|nr:biopolymer transporter ExbD [Litorilituus sp.]
MMVSLENIVRKKPTIGLTPLIDVVFILLIFFMLVMNFQRYQMQEIDIAPRSEIANKSDTFTIEIINNTECSFEQTINQCLKIAHQIPAQNTDLVIRYQAATKLKDIIHWYQYFGSKYPTSLAVPVIEDVINES